MPQPTQAKNDFVPHGGAAAPALAAKGSSWMASARDAVDIECVRSKASTTGFRNVIMTTSGKFQAKIYVAAEKRQRALGSFATAEEAATAVVLAERAKPTWDDKPTAKRAKRGTVRAASFS